ncbi:MAG: hypothetical protein KGD68_11820 [Candidatus Lokiarchaeota archaeon]|nr:hypothetical protein [Candidatus Lokiarchaeota archaeon]
MAQSVKIKQLHQIISALERFQTRKNDLFSLDKLAGYLNLSERDLVELLELVFRFQHLFGVLFDDRILCKKWKKEKIYLILKPKCEVKNNCVIEPKEIEIDKDQSEILNDIVYYYQHVKIGRGFDVKSNGAEFSKKVKRLKSTHPFFFENRGNGLICPSKLAVEAGNLIRSYSKIKKSVSKLEIEDYLIKMV